MEVNFNFFFTNSNLILLRVTEFRNSEIVTHAFQIFFW